MDKVSDSLLASSRVGKRVLAEAQPSQPAQNGDSSNEKRQKRLQTPTAEGNPDNTHSTSRADVISKHLQQSRLRNISEALSELSDDTFRTSSMISLDRPPP